MSSEHFRSFDEYRFPWPWSDLRRWPPEEGEALVRELLLEIGSDHGFAKDGVQAIARFNRQDEVLYRTNSGTFAMVHLSWSSRRDTFVTPRILEAWQDVVDLIVDDGRLVERA